MPVRLVPHSNFQYYLVVYDEQGQERAEPGGSYLTDAVLKRVKDTSQPVTDVFFTSHGWKGDVPAAIEQYDAWVGTMLSQQADVDAARQQRPGFMPLVVGLHWPSLPWGDESIPVGSGGLLSSNSAPAPASVDELVDAFARRIADTPKAREALRVIVQASQQVGAPVRGADLTPDLLAAYATVFAESGLGVGDTSGRPGADQDGFDPAAIIDAARADGITSGAGGTVAPGLLGWTDDLRDALLSPLRQASFWKMKDRARVFGEAGGHSLLRQLQLAAPEARFHLMGHSFGCIVVSATVAGPAGGPGLPRPVDSLFLVQGALSLWSYAPDIPFAPGTQGYFNRILRNGLVRGPIVTTRSSHDTAVGRLYPLGAKAKKQLILADELPVYGGIGSFGICGVPQAMDLIMQNSRYNYDFRAGGIYNLNCNDIIKNGGGFSGAHSDIAHSEVAHAFWSATLGRGNPFGSTLSNSSGASEDRLYKPSGLPPFNDKNVASHSRTSQPGLLGGDDRPVGHVSARPAQQTQLQQPQQPQQQRQQPLRQDTEREEQRQQMQVRQEEDTGPQTYAQPRMGRGAAAAAPPEDRFLGASDEAEFDSDEDGAGGGSTGGGQPIRHPAAVDEANPASARWINAELEDHAPDQALKVHQWYTLAFDVDVKQRADAVGAVVVDETGLFKPVEQEVHLTIQLNSADFELPEHSRFLRLPRVGRSLNKARFDISPLHDGPSALTATIHKDGNFIQQMQLSFDVGASVPTSAVVTARGRPARSAEVVRPRDMGLSISAGAAGYDCLVWKPVSARARLPLTAPYLASAVDAARREIMKVVMHQDATGDYVFQTRIDIPETDSRFALKVLARAGALLFQKLFFGPAAGADSKAIGDFLRRMAADPTTRLTLQIVAESTPLPWGLLYMGDASEGAELSWDNFLGLRHVIELIPLQTTLTVTDNAIRSNQPSLSVSINVNQKIDQDMAADFVARQQAFWASAQTSFKSLRVTSRSTRAELLKALRSEYTDDQILYFFGHAETNGLGSAGGPDASSLVLSDASITLESLNLDAPASTQLRGNPLVFINACESAELSPAFYDGFVPYFMAKGARGVVGTECKTPALFAAEWAARFFKRFLDGEPLGLAFLELRREFLQDHGNPLGLLYAVYCDGDTKVDPALHRAV